MKIRMVVILVIALALLVWGYFTGQSEDADTAFSAVISYIIGACLLLADVVLLVVWVVYRLTIG